MNEEILIPMTMAAMVVAIVWLVQAYASRNRAALLLTVRTAIEQGSQLSPEIIRSLGAPASSKHGDIKWGVILISAAIAFITLGAAIGSTDGDDEIVTIMAGVAAFPGFIGLSLLGYGLVMMRMKD